MVSHIKRVAGEVVRESKGCGRPTKETWCGKEGSSNN